MVKLTGEARGFLRDLLRQGKSQAIKEGKKGEEVDELTVRIAPSSCTEVSGAQVGLRLQVSLKLSVERPHSGDQVIVDEGERLLAVHPVIGELLEGATLDTVEAPNGGRLQVKRKGTEAA